MEPRTREELMEGAKNVLDMHPKADKVLAATDGNYFLPAQEGDCKDHCRKEKIGFFEFTREELKDWKPEEKSEVPESEEEKTDEVKYDAAKQEATLVTNEEDDEQKGKPGFTDQRDVERHGH